MNVGNISDFSEIDGMAGTFRNFSHVAIFVIFRNMPEVMGMLEFVRIYHNLATLTESSEFFGLSELVGRYGNSWKFLEYPVFFGSSQNTSTIFSVY